MIAAEGTPTPAAGKTLYRLLPYRGELAIFGRLLPRRSAILELGCGTGRLTEALLDAGHKVTAVDNSPEMLRHVRDDADKVLANIEHLELRRRFDVALLASCLVYKLIGVDTSVQEQPYSSTDDRAGL